LCLSPGVPLDLPFFPTRRSSDLGAMAQVLMLNIISLWLLRVPLSYGAVYLFGDPGVALGIGTSFALSCGFSAAYYKWGGWRSKVLFRSGSAPAAARG